MDNATMAGTYPGKIPSVERVAPVPDVIPALHEFAEASHTLAVRSEELLLARANHNEAKERWNHLRDAVAKTQEQFGV